MNTLQHSYLSDIINFYIQSKNRTCTSLKANMSTISEQVYMNGFNPYAPNNGDDIPNDPGKMFIGGLSWQTTPESIREYFSSFGDLAEVMVMKDPATRRSRGFGFITFSDPTGVEKVMKYPVHQVRCLKY